MTGDELEARMTGEELLEWQEKLKMEIEAHERVMRDAKAKSKPRRR